MADFITIDRRDFLKIGVAGGFLLGLHLRARGKTAQEAQATGDSTVFAPNAWIRITGDGSIHFLVARSEMGQGVMTSLPMLIAEELGVGLDQISVRFAAASPEYKNQLIGQQLTGGSTSIRDAWTKLREAGAIARTMLVEVAALRWQVAADDCRVERAQVLHPDGKLRFGFGELAEQAASISIPSGVFLKDAGQWTLIGTPAPRLDTPKKVAGTARYGIDVLLTNMSVACVERCPVFGGRPRSVEADVALALPGVLAVVPISAGIAVVAEDTWTALRARELLQIDWQFGPNAAVSSASILARFERELDATPVAVRSTGDIKTALSDAAHVIEAVYETPFQAHACMEPMNCTADVRADGCDLYVPTQAQTGCQRTGMEITGLDESKVRVHTTFLGGGFGRRGEQDFVRDAVELSKQLRRPVQVIWTREDDIRHDFYRPAGLNRLRGGLDAEGLPIAWHQHIVGHSILSRVAPDAVADGKDRTSVEGAANLPYAIANLQVDYRLDNTHVPVGFWRAVGSSQNAWITECFLDELAAAGYQEPLALRRRLLSRQPRYLRVLDLAADKAGWETPASAGRHRGIAVAESFGSCVAQVAEISIDAGRVLVHRVVCAVDCGQVVNPDTVVAQMESGIIYGLSATLKGAITIDNGRVQQSNFDTFPLLRMSETPAIDVHLVASDEAPGGVGEPGLPPIAPAVCNAVFAATGRPVRTLPIRI